MTCRKSAVGYCQQGTETRGIKGMSYNSCREDFCCDDVARYTVPEGPSKGVEIDCHSADNATRRSATAVAGGLASKSNVQGQVQHAGGLDASANNERQAASDVLDEIADVEDGSHEFHNAVNACGEQAVTVADADDLEDSGCEVLSQVSWWSAARWAQ